MARPCRNSVFNLVSWAEQYGRVRDLLSAAQSQNPRNESLQNLVTTLESSLRPSTTSAAPMIEPVISSALLPSAVDVFLSYSRRLYRCHASSARGLARQDWSSGPTKGWSRARPAGAQPSKAAICQSKAMVALLSPNANVSVWVDNEVAYAQALGKRVVILVAGDAASAVPINLIRVQWIDGRQDLQRVVMTELQPHLLHQVGSTVAAANTRLAFEWIAVRSPAGCLHHGQRRACGHACYE